MAQSERSTQDGTGLDSKLPSVTPVKLENARSSASRLEEANSFFSSLNTDTVIKPDASEVATATRAAAAQDEIVAELDTSQEDDLDDVLDEVLGPKLQQQLPAPDLNAKSKVPSKLRRSRSGRRRIRKAKPAVVIETREDEPFHWKDLFTRKGLKKNSSFLFSLLAHVLFVLFLSLLVVRNGIGDSSLFLDVAEAPAGIDEEMLDGLDINQLEFDDDNAELAESETDDLMDEILEEVESEKEALKTEDFESEMASSNAKKVEGRAKGDGKSASFFGTRASGRRFVFVVDRSISMEYGSRNFVSRELFNRYDVAKSELFAAIDSLQPHQEFFVVMFAHDTIPMFESASDLGSPKMLAATPENIARFKKWLDRIGTGPGTDPREGLQMAIDMKPDAIFMLSDGEFVSERNDDRPKTLDIVKSHTAAGTIVPINTVSLVVKKTIPAMKSIANMSEGRFRFTTIDKYVRQVARLRGPMRFRAVNQLVSGETRSWTERQKQIRDYLLPMLNDGSPVERARGESLINRATMGLFEKMVPSALEDRQAAISRWNDIVHELTGYALTGQVSALGQGRETQQKLFLALLDPKDESFLLEFEKLDLDRTSVLTQVEMVRALEQFHQDFGTTPESVGWLRFLMLKLDGKQPRERADLARVNWNAEQAQAAVERFFEKRAESSARMFRKYGDPDLASNLRDRLAKNLVSKFPETDAALRVLESLDARRAEDSGMVSESNDPMSELFGQ